MLETRETKKRTLYSVLFLVSRVSGGADYGVRGGLFWSETHTIMVCVPSVFREGSQLQPSTSVGLTPSSSQSISYTRAPTPSTVSIFITPHALTDPSQTSNEFSQHHTTHPVNSFNHSTHKHSSLINSFFTFTPPILRALNSQKNIFSHLIQPEPNPHQTSYVLKSTAFSNHSFSCLSRREYPMNTHCGLKD